MTPERPKSPKVDKTAEQLIRHNGELVNALFASEVYSEILFPLITEGIASVSGRITNGRYYHGDLTLHPANGLFNSGYQKALMDLHNRLHDFVLAKDKFSKNLKQKEQDKNAPLYNPFMEADNEEARYQ